MNAAGAAGAARASLRVTRPKIGTPTASTLVVAGLAVVGAGLRFWRIGHQGYWYDEGVTVALLHHSLGGMLGLLPKSEGSPPVFYCLAWLWARIFGFGEAGVRSLSAVAGVLVIPAMYGFATKLVSRRAGLIAAGLAACNPFLIWYSQDARAYSLMLLFATVSLLAFAHLLSANPPRRWLVVWALAAGLTLATQYYGVLAVVPAAGWLLWLHRTDRRAWLAVAAVAAVGLALLPLALSQSGNAAWIAGAPLGQRLSQIPPQFLIGTGAPLRDWLKLVGAAAVVLAAALLAARADTRERRGAMLAGGLAGAGFALSLLLIVFGVDYVITRNLIVLLVGLIVVVATGLGARRAGLLGLAGTAALCAIGVIATIGVAVDWVYQRPAWGAVARIVTSDRQAGTARAILVENTNSGLPLSDYIPGLHPMFGRGTVVRELDVVAAVKEPSVTFCWWGAACHLPPAALDTSINLHGFERVGPVVHIDQFSIYRLRAGRAVAVTRSQVIGALLASSLQNYGVFVEPPT